MEAFGPFLITALPEEFAGLTTEIVAELKELVLKTGDVYPQESLCRRSWARPMVSVSVSTKPDHLRMMIGRFPGVVIGSDLAVIFLTEESNNYLVWDRNVTVDDIIRILERQEA
jgi:hypothetical protein